LSGRALVARTHPIPVARGAALATLEPHGAPSLNSDILRGACYLFAAALCLFAATIEWGEREARPRIPWVWAAVGALIIGIAAAEWWNVGHAVADLGRSEARDEGWYGDRRPVQAAVIGAVVVAITIAWLAVGARWARSYRRYWPVLSAVVALLAFLLVRAISLHALDAAFNRDVVGIMRAGDLVEIAGAIAISAAALLQVILRPERSDQPGIPTAG
jgi:hypothetical protein